MPKRRVCLLVRAGSVAAAAVILAACTPGGQFDPTVLLDNDMFSSKKELTGQREPVFPGGVPGTATGIPPDLVKGYQPPPDEAAAPQAGGQAAAQQPQQPVAEAEPKATPKPKRKPKVARAAPPRTQISVNPAATQPGPAQPAQTTAWPAPQQNAQSGWPAPPPTGQQPSQSVWPNPPPPGSSTQ